MWGLNHTYSRLAPAHSPVVQPLPASRISRGLFLVRTPSLRDGVDIVDRSNVGRLCLALCAAVPRSTHAPCGSFATCCSGNSGRPRSMCGSMPPCSSSGLPLWVSRGFPSAFKLPIGRPRPSLSWVELLGRLGNSTRDAPHSRHPSGGSGRALHAVAQGSGSACSLSPAGRGMSRLAQPPAEPQWRLMVRGLGVRRKSPTPYAPHPTLPRTGGGLAKRMAYAPVAILPLRLLARIGAASFHLWKKRTARPKGLPWLFSNVRPAGATRRRKCPS